VPDCPVCGLSVSSPKGLSIHFRHQKGDEAHAAYLAAQEDAKWAELTEDEDYVVCRLCGHRAVTLARHIKATHGITAKEYRAQFPDALIRGRELTARRGKAIKAGWGEGAHTGTKTITCPTCESEHEVHKSFVPSTHDARCPECKGKQAGEWDGKVEGHDYVVCGVCGHKAENLTSHVTAEHPELVGRYQEVYPGALLVALGSTVRDKTALRGLKRPEGFGRKISESKTLGLTAEDFEPYRESDGTIDHHAAQAGFGIAMPTVRQYMETLGLEITSKYVDQRYAERRVALTPADLEPFKLKNGKVSLARAIEGLRFSYPTVRRECDRLGLPYFNRRIKQTLCLDTVESALGGVSYIEEWRSRRFVNPPTGQMFRYDGYFPHVGLIVEFQGHQHYMFPNAFMSDDKVDEFIALQERDRIKREMIEQDPSLLYLEILEDEPYQDPKYIRARLEGLGIEVPAIGV